MEPRVTFQPGLESLGEKLAAKVRGRKKGEAETVWDAYVRRRSEKKAEQRRKGRKDVDSSEDEESEDAGSPLSPLEGEEDPFFQREEDPFNDPFFNDGAPQAAEGASDEEGRGAAKTGGRAEKRAGKKGKEAETGTSWPLSAAQKAELEMLLMDDPGRSALPVSAEAAPAAKKKLTKKERVRQKKEAKRREREEGSDAEAEPDVPAGKSLEDPRFAALMTSSAFALDPTDPRFDKRSAALAQKLSSRRAKGAPAAQTPAAAPESAPEPTPSAGSALEAMVKSLKRKSKAGAGSASKAKRL
ncbi:hypothetical protein QBZ16_003378 [Prototheca wickerhamii]|uniref:NUC153 domain-containing protein n=1 Tax=Prototheca wickerhamii TaxID=3111 RepID=A0AAD9IJ53_PROWI|nr:hypothetical protein QBZ16_003378 [Prototheca wickerhamii]